MTGLRQVLASVFIAAALCLSGTLAAKAQPMQIIPPMPKPGVAAGQKPETHVYLMRGLFGVFSLGMDDLAEKLRNDGYHAGIYGWDSWPSVAQLIRQTYNNGHRGPVVVIGHSLGANAVFNVADNMNQNNIPMLLGVTFDATEPGTVPTNVKTFINFYARDGFGNPVNPAPGFTGELDNFDLSSDGTITHTNIDALGRFHSLILQRLDRMTSTR